MCDFCHFSLRFIVSFVAFYDFRFSLICRIHFSHKACNACEDAKRNKNRKENGEEKKPESVFFLNVHSYCITNPNNKVQFRIAIGIADVLVKREVARGKE